MINVKYILSLIDSLSEYGFDGRLSSISSHGHKIVYVDNKLCSKHDTISDARERIRENKTNDVARP